MKKIAGWGLLFLLSYTAGLIYWLPTQQLYHYAKPFIKPEISDRVEPLGLSGTLWQGSVAKLRIDGHTLGRASWSIQPLWLLQGDMGLTWLLQQRHGHLGGEATTAIDRSGELIRDVEGEFAIDLIMQFFPFLPVVLEGRVDVDLQQIGIKGKRITSAIGVVEWRQASVTAPVKIALGDLLLELEPPAADAPGKSVVAGQLSNSGGELEVSGTFTLAKRGRYQSEVVIAARAGAPDQVKNSLGLLGRRGRDGKYHIKRSGTLR